MLSKSVALALLATAASAKYCQNFTIPVTISARNGVFGNVMTPITNAQATEFSLNSTRQGANGSALALTGYATVAGTYNISAKLCSPANSTTMSNSSSSSSLPPLQILTHGIGFDKTYWDLAYNNYNYSYINVALAAGYHTLSYDRLGIGNSSHGDPRDEIQSFLEVQALAAITNMARNGSLPAAASGSYSKVAHVGHSFGSSQTYALTALYPNISDAIILTGFSTNSSFLGLFNAGGAYEQAYLNQPLRFGNMSQQVALETLLQTYPALLDLTAGVDFTTLKPLNYAPGYLVTGSEAATNFQFLYNGYFDPKILQFAEQGKQPFTVGEALTLGGIPMMSPFAGPALVITGSNDVPFCGGNCTATGNPMIPSVPSTVSKSLPNASPFEAYIQPGSGHGLNFHYNATGGYQVIQSFLAANGLSATSTTNSTDMKLIRRSF